jgi:hypothetical protein
LDYSKEMNTSVGDGVMQTYFCLHELREDFPAVYHTLCSSTSIDECADLVCVRYECPAVNNYAARRNYAHTFEQDIPDSPEKPPEAKHWDWKVALIQFVMQHDGYWGEVDGLKSDEFFAALRTYTDDMEKC